MKKFLIVLTASLLLISCNNPTDKSQLTSEEVIDYVSNELEKNHKDLYANISKEEFQKKKEEIKSKIQNMKESKEIYNGVLELVALIGDSHTRGIYQGDDLEYILYNMRFFEDSWRLSSIDNENKKYLGQKVTGFNNSSIEEFEKLSRKMVSYDNETRFKLDMPNIVNTKDIFEYLEISEPNSDIIIHLEDEEGNNSNIKLKTTPTPQGNFVGDMPENLPKTYPSGYYRSFDIDEDNLFIQYNLCKEEPNYKMKKFTKDIEEFLEKYNFKNVIIDLRYNPGGDSRVLEPFIEMLEKHKEDKKYFVLIGSETFSSAILNSISMKDRLDAILIGSPTGGSANHFGEVKTFDIPNQPIKVTYSTKFFESLSGAGIDSLMPDIEIPQTYENFKNGIDAEIEYILKNY